MKKLYFSPILTVIFLLCPLMSFSQSGLETALSAFKSGDYQASEQQLVRLLKTDHKNAVYWFNLGHVYTKLSDDAKASKCYRRVVFLKSSLAPAARYYLAKLLVKNGELVQARKELEIVISTKSTPENIKTLSRELLSSLSDYSGVEEAALQTYQAGDYPSALNTLKSIPESSLSEDGQLLLLMTHTRLNNRKEFNEKKRQIFRMSTVSSHKRSLILEMEKNFTGESGPGRPFTLFIDASAGRNSNVYAEGDSVSPLSSIETRLFAGGTYQWSIGSREFIRAGYSYFRNSFSEASALDSVTHSLRGSYIKNENKRTLELTPYLQLHNWGGVTVSNRIGGTGVISESFSSGEYGLIGDLNKRTSLEDTYDYLDAYAGSGKAYVSWFLTRFYLELNGIVGFDGSQDIVYDDGGRLPLSNFYYGPGFRGIWKATDQLQLNVLGSYTLRNYENKTAPGKETRSDKELFYTLRLNYFFHPSTSVYLQYEGFQNASTLGPQSVRDKTYDVSTQFIGLMWDYL